MFAAQVEALARVWEAMQVAVERYDEMRSRGFRLVIWEAPEPRQRTRFRCRCGGWLETDIVVEYADELMAFCSCGKRMLDYDALQYRVQRHREHNRQAREKANSESAGRGL